MPHPAQAEEQPHLARLPAASIGGVIHSSLRWRSSAYLSVHYVASFVPLAFATRSFTLEGGSGRPRRKP